MSCFQLLNEQQKRESSGVELIQLHATDGRLERTMWGETEKGVRNYRRGKLNWVKEYIGTDDVDPTYRSEKFRRRFGIPRTL